MTLETRRSWSILYIWRCEVGQGHGSLVLSISLTFLDGLRKLQVKYRQTRKQEPNKQGTTKKEILLSFVSSRICKESWDFSNKTCFQCNSYKLQLTWYVNCLISRVENDWNIGLGPRIKIRKPSNSQLTGEWYLWTEEHIGNIKDNYPRFWSFQMLLANREFIYNLGYN